MKQLVTICLVILTCLTSNAQTPRDFFTFQGVARNGEGKIMSNTNVRLRLSIHPLLNAPVFIEEHEVTTNQHGVFTLFVGGGQLVNGNYTNIDWSSGYYFLNAEMDISGGSNFQNLGSTQLVSVPYALHAKQTDRWKNNVPIVQTGFFEFGEPLPDQVAGTRLIWYPKKAAFRAGYINSDAWNNNNIGQHSTSFGFDTKASGMSSFAVGNVTAATGTGALASGDRSIASGNFSTAIGSETEAQGSFATSLGRETIAKGAAATAIGIQNTAHGVGSLAAGYLTSAEGNMSFAIGEGTYAKAFASTTIGAYNNLQDNPLGPTYTDARDTDRIFQIGNGSGENSLSNALTVLRNGNVGVGNGALIPQYILDIDGRPRIKHNVKTAGIYFDDSANKPSGFVGMKTDDQIGFYLGEAWRFWVNGSGGATLIGGLDQVSDRRLKRDFANLSNSLSKLSQIDGVAYYWKDQSLAQTIQTGLIAQNVETVFPELVTTNAEGFKSVNYIGLIPHLIESVKELKQENASLRKQLERIDELEAKLNTIAGAAMTENSKSSEVK